MNLVNLVILLMQVILVFLVNLIIQIILAILVNWNIFMVFDILVLFSTLGLEGWSENGNIVNILMQNIFVDIYTWNSTQDDIFYEGVFKAALQPDGEPLFVARATINGGHAIGMLNPKLSYAQVPYDGGERYIYGSYEVLVFNTESPPVEWVAAPNGDLPEGEVAILAGREANGEPLYVVKALVDNQVYIGKLNLDHGAAYVPYNGAELVVTTYEVLVMSSSKSTVAIGSTISSTTTTTTTTTTTEGTTIYPLTTNTPTACNI